MEVEAVSLFSYATAFGAGLISFLSPCVLPVVPGYLSVVTGVDVTSLERGDREGLRQVAATTGLFIAGFSVVFISLGTAASGLGQILADQQLILSRLSGALVLAMGLFLLGSLYLQSPWLYQEKRFHPDLGRWGRAAPPVAGVAFGFGWTPCIGPVLGSILTIAATSGRASTGATLLAAYSAGLGLPFLAAGLAFSRFAGAFTWIKRHSNALTLTAGFSLVLFGTLLALGRLSLITSTLIDNLEGTPLDFLIRLG